VVNRQDRQTDTVPLHRPCYASSVKNRINVTATETDVMSTTDTENLPQQYKKCKKNYGKFWQKANVVICEKD